MNDSKTFYETLGVGEDATEEDIKRAFRSKANKAHPDKGGSQSDMAELNRAYRVLINPVARIAYDQSGVEPQLDDGEQRAKAILLEQFDRVLRGEPKHDYINAVRDAIQAIISGTVKQQMQVDTIMTELKRRRKRVKVKKRGVRNLWHQLIDQNLKNIKAEKGKLVAELEAQQRAMELLDNYEGVEEEIMIEYMFGGTGTATTTTW